MSAYSRTALRAAIAAHLPESDRRKSSHWQHYTSNRAIDAQGEVAGVWGFGTRVPDSFHRKAAHALLQRQLLGWKNPVFNSAAYRAARSYCNAQGRIVDMDVLRHCFTLELLGMWHNQLGRPTRICVIGDGQANFVTAGLYAERYQKIFSVNLADVLLNDLDLLLTCGRLTENELRLIEAPSDVLLFLQDPVARVGLICADQTELINAAQVELFVNIASFQEMTPEIVADYFDMIRDSGAALYCCNREEKVLPGGEALIFDQYPWGTAQILLDEHCPWHQRFYATRPPFFRPYDGPTRHRLATWKGTIR